MIINERIKSVIIPQTIHQAALPIIANKFKHKRNAINARNKI